MYICDVLRQCSSSKSTDCAVSNVSIALIYSPTQIVIQVWMSYVGRLRWKWGLRRGLLLHVSKTAFPSCSRIWKWPWSAIPQWPWLSFTGSIITSVMWLNRLWRRTGLTRFNLPYSYELGVVLLWRVLNDKITRAFTNPGTTSNLKERQGSVTKRSKGKILCLGICRWEIQRLLRSSVWVYWRIIMPTQCSPNDLR